MSKGRESNIRRGRLSRLLQLISPISLVTADSRSGIRNSGPDRLKVESLETRQLLAGDVQVVSADLMGPLQDNASTAPIVAASTGVSEGGLRVVSEAEGEPAPDLVQFALDLDAAGVQFYGANWCPACTQQKQLFQDGGDDLPFIEVTNPDRTASQFAIDNNITAYPTWEFPDGTADGNRVEGVLSLEQLSTLSGIPIPQSEDPTFAPIGNQTALIGSPLHIPIDGYDPDSDSLTVTVSVDNPNLLEAEVLSGNRSIRINMQGYGDMVFELYEQRAPRASGRVIELAEADFYDDIIFHRVIDNFVIQGGDPTGTGTSGSTLPDFDDDFHPDLQHNSGGILSFAKSSDDTNNSQFFVTETPTRHLDFNHSIFGQLIEGEDVRQAISNHAVNGASKPTTDITIDTIDVFTDLENSVVMLKPTGNGTGSTNVTFTITDGDGNSHSETVQVDVLADTSNGQPFLNDITIPDRFDPNTPATLQLSSTDVEGDPVTYAATSSSSDATVVVDQNGLLTVTPQTGFTGEVRVNASVSPGPGVTGNSSSDRDNQVYVLNFESDVIAAPTSIDLRDSSDTGASATDNITNASTLSFTIDGVENGANVQLVNVVTSAVLGEGVASGSSVTINTDNIAALGDGEYRVAARQIVGNNSSVLTSPLIVNYDTTAPALVASSATTRANVGRQYVSDLVNDEEGSITYALTDGPSTATIDSGSGVILWTPDAGDVGSNGTGTTNFTVQTTDIAGNTQTETFTVNVAEEPRAEVALVARDLNGNEITSLNVGDDFILELVGVDARPALDRSGVFAIFADVLFDSNIIGPRTGTASDIENVGDFTLTPSGTFSTGLIDELGAASSRTVATNESESVIARVQMRALASGSVNLRSEPAEGSGREILLYGDNNQIPADSVAFGTLSLTVGLSFTLAGDAITIAEDAGATVVDVLANDTVTGSNTLSVISVTQPQTGGFVVVNSGEVRFTPEADFNGTTEFTYRAGDGSGAQDTATVTVTVTAVNDPPTGVADTFNVVEDTTNNRLDVLANDSIDPDSGETLTVTGTSSSAQGATVSVTSDGSAVNYTPASGFVGTDTFTYTVSDGQETTEVSVTVTVAQDDNPPTAVDDAFSINEDTAEASYDVLQNDQQDVDNETFVLDSVESPSEGGAARISTDGSTFFYTPAADFFGTETVVYTIRDTGGGLAVGTVTFTVAGINDAPPVSSPTVQLVRGSGASVVLNLSDLPDNPDGDTETITLNIVGTPSAGGTATIDANGNLSYTPPNATFTGTDTVTFSVSDGSGTTSDGTVTIQVQDFTERDITVNFNGGQGAAIRQSVRLVGTNELGNAVDTTATLTNTNDLVFENLLPGDYSIEIPAIPFFEGAEQPRTISAQSAVDDGDMTVDVTMGRLHAEYRSIRDWLGSAPRESALVVVQAGQSALATDTTPAADASINDPVITLNEAGTALSIEGKNDADEDVTASVLTTQSGVIEQRGQIGDLLLYRVDVSNDAVGYQPVTAGAGTASAAGTQLAGSNSTTSDTGSNDNPLLAASNGEAEPSDAVSQELVQAVPSVSGLSAVGTGLSAVGTGEGESVESASSVTNVSAPLLSSDVLRAASVASDAAETEVETSEPEVVAEPAQTRTFGLRRFVSSGNTPAEPRTGISRLRASSGADSSHEETSDLSAESVDQVLRGEL